jgi:hypothetical protein
VRLKKIKDQRKFQVLIFAKKKKMIYKSKKRDFWQKKENTKDGKGRV